MTAWCHDRGRYSLCSRATSPPPRLEDDAMRAMHEVTWVDTSVDVAGVGGGWKRVEPRSIRDGEPMGGHRGRPRPGHHLSPTSRNAFVSLSPANAARPHGLKKKTPDVGDVSAWAVAICSRVHAGPAAKERGEAGAMAAYWHHAGLVWRRSKPAVTSASRSHRLTCFRREQDDRLLHHQSQEGPHHCPQHRDRVTPAAVRHLTRFTAVGVQQAGEDVGVALTY